MLGTDFFPGKDCVPGKSYVAEKGSNLVAFCSASVVRYLLGSFYCHGCLVDAPRVQYSRFSPSFVAPVCLGLEVEVEVVGYWRLFYRAWLALRHLARLIWKLLSGFQAAPTCFWA